MPMNLLNIDLVDAIWVESLFGCAFQSSIVIFFSNSEDFGFLSHLIIFDILYIIIFCQWLVAGQITGRWYVENDKTLTWPLNIHLTSYGKMTHWSCSLKYPMVSAAFAEKKLIIFFYWFIYIYTGGVFLVFCVCVTLLHQKCGYVVRKHMYSALAGDNSQNQI